MQLLSEILRNNKECAISAARSYKSATQLHKDIVKIACLHIGFANIPLMQKLGEYNDIELISIMCESQKSHYCVHVDKVFHALAGKIGQLCEPIPQRCADMVKFNQSDWDFDSAFSCARALYFLNMHDTFVKFMQSAACDWLMQIIQYNTSAAWVFAFMFLCITEQYGIVDIALINEIENISEAKWIERASSAKIMGRSAKVKYSNYCNIKVEIVWVPEVLQKLNKYHLVQLGNEMMRPCKYTAIEQLQNIAVDISDLGTILIEDENIYFWIAHVRYMLCRCKSRAEAANVCNATSLLSRYIWQINHYMQGIIIHCPIIVNLNAIVISGNLSHDKAFYICKCAPIVIDVNCTYKDLLQSPMVNQLLVLALLRYMLGMPAAINDGASILIDSEILTLVAHCVAHNKLSASDLNFGDIFPAKIFKYMRSAKFAKHREYVLSLEIPQKYQMLLAEVRTALI